MLAKLQQNLKNIAIISLQMRQLRQSDTVKKNTSLNWASVGKLYSCNGLLFVAVFQVRDRL